MEKEDSEVAVSLGQGLIVTDFSKEGLADPSDWTTWPRYKWATAETITRALGKTPGSIEKLISKGALTRLDGTTGRDSLVLIGDVVNIWRRKSQHRRKPIIFKEKT